MPAPEQGLALRWHQEGTPYDVWVFVALALTAIAGTTSYGIIMGLLDGPRAMLLGGLLLMHEARGWFEHLLLTIAIAFGTINIVGGFLVTDRMLEMFKRKPDAEPSAEATPSAETDGGAPTKVEAKN